MLTVEDNEGDIMHVVDVKGFTTEWDEWSTNVKHHAEWVAMLTYLRYVADLSRCLHWNGKDGATAADVDMDLIMASTAFQPHVSPYAHLSYGMETPGMDTTTDLSTDEPTPY
jgi:hypothetical protein